MTSLLLPLTMLLSILPGGQAFPTGLYQAVPDFDFQTLALGLAAISFGGIGALMAGAFLFGETAEKAKRTWLPTTIVGLILVGVASFIIGILGG